MRWIASMGSTVTDGSSRRCRGLSIDVTDRKQMEEASARQRSEIEHLSRLASLGELSGAMAHELNQPLGSILANAQAVRRMMEDAGAATEEWREVIDDIISEDQRAGAVIRRLRQLVRRGETLRERVDINDCIRGMLELLRGEMIDKKIVVETSLCKTEPIVIGDPVQLQQVILNLAANARDAMEACPPHGRRLMVRTSCQAERVVIEVCDTGPGHDGDPDMLFQSFYTTKAQGLGLGLPICRSILDAHDGTIRCSRADSGGMLFRIELPLADTP
jgi:C4-dicarboxylate-specific signal transduction histidine kinase